MPLLKDALKSIEFCEQIIFVDDCSTDGSLKEASKYTDEIYMWYGSDSMAERRMYAIGHKGNKHITPEYLSNDRMKDNVPVVKHDWTLYIDSDEVIAHPKGLEHIKSEFTRIMDTDNEGAAMLLVNLLRDGKGTVQTTSALLRFFKSGTLWFRGKIQHRVEHGQPVEGIDVNLLHFGYGDKRSHSKKFLDRLPALQLDNAENPTEMSRRRYVINNLCALASNQKHFQEAVEQIDKYIELFLESDKKKDDQMLMAATIRHAYPMIMKFGQYEMIEQIMEHVGEFVAWAPDMPYYRFVCALHTNKDIVEHAESYFKAIEDMMSGNTPNMECESLNKRYAIARTMVEHYSNNDWDKAKEWNKKFLEYL